jgi:hypothetical protein
MTSPDERGAAGSSLVYRLRPLQGTSHLKARRADLDGQ